MQNANFCGRECSADQQMEIDSDETENFLSWVRGNGGSHATHMGLKRILATLENTYESMRNVISTPVTWHTKATDLNSCASNQWSSRIERSIFPLP
jgi:hypothetical protein